MDSKEVRTLMEAYASVYFDETMMGESMVRGSNPIPGKTLPQSTPTSNPAPAPTPAKPQLSQRSQAILSGNSPLSRDPRARGGFDPRFDKKPSAPSTPSTSSFAPKPPTPSTPTSTPSTSSSAPKPPTPSTPTSAPKPGGGGGLFGSLDKFARDSAGKLGGEVGAKKGRETAGNIFGIPEKIGRDRGTKKGQEMYDRAKETLGGFLKQDYEPDAFDIILEYLVAEGYADTNENALVIMANMGEEWRQSIVEAEVLAKKGGVEGVGTGANWKAKSWTDTEKSRYSSYQKPTTPAANSSGDAPKASGSAPAPARPQTTQYDVDLYKLKSIDANSDFERRAMAARLSPVAYQRKLDRDAEGRKAANM